MESWKGQVLTPFEASSHESNRSSERGRRVTYAVCIVHYRDPHAIERLLGEIVTWVHAPTRCIIIDNSSELRAEALAELARGLLVEVIDPGDNLGYAAAGNLGLRSCIERSVDAMLLLTQDAQIDDGLVSSLNERLAREPRAAIVAPLLAFVTRPSVTFSRGGYLRRDGRFNHHMALSPISESVGHGLISVDWVDGACLMIRVSAAEEVGLIPEDYFLYAEDVDFGLGLRLQGWSVYVDSDVVARQEPGNFSPYFRGRNLLRFLIKRRHSFTSYAIPMFVLKEIAYSARRGPRDLAWTTRGLFDARRGRMGRPPKSLAGR